MSTCLKILKLLFERRIGTPGIQAQIDEHLAACTRCASFWADLHQDV